MQVVGKIQAIAPVQDNALNSVMTLLDRWAASKFSQDDSGMSVIRKSQAPALVDRRDEHFDGLDQSTFEVLEQIPGGDLTTHVRVLSGADRIHFNCTLSLSVTGGLAPPNIDLHAPRFVRDILGLELGWRASEDAERIVPTFIDVREADVETFLSLLQSRQRRLPLIVVSEYNGQTIAGDLHARVATDICGLGHTCRISREAAWAITQTLDKEWSCYNGAVRLFWPFRANQEDPRNHPLWTYDSLTRRGERETEVRDRLRRRIRERLLDASAFLADDPALDRFSRLRAQPAREPSAIGTTPDEVEGLKSDLAIATAALRERDDEIAVLKSNLEALNIALRSQAPRPGADEAGENAPPSTVLEAVVQGRSRHEGLVLFGADVEGYAKELNPEAGPPDKVLRYLDTLAEMAAALEKGPLGKSVPTWLKDRGVEASVESDTVKNNKAARQRRTFTIGDDAVFCELHAKPTDNVPPDHCIRIYFEKFDHSPHVRIGYIGRHFD